VTADAISNAWLASGSSSASIGVMLVERVNNPRLRILPCRTELNPIPLWLSWRAQRNSRSVSDAMATLQLVLDELMSNDA